MNTSSFCHGIVDIDGSDSIGICEKKLFSIKNPKAAENKTNLGPRGTSFPKHPSTWPLCTVSMFCEDTPCNFGPKMLRHLIVADFGVRNPNIDNFIVSPVRSRCIESDVAFIFGSQLGRSLMEASGSAGHESDQDTSAHPWCIWTCFWIGLKENSE